MWIISCNTSTNKKIFLRWLKSQTIEIPPASTNFGSNWKWNVRKKNFNYSKFLIYFFRDLLHHTAFLCIELPKLLLLYFFWDMKKWNSINISKNCVLRHKTNIITYFDEWMHIHGLKKIYNSEYLIYERYFISFA